MKTIPQTVKINKQDFNIFSNYFVMLFLQSVAFSQAQIAFHSNTENEIKCLNISTVFKLECQLRGP